MRSTVLAAIPLLLTVVVGLPLALFLLQERLLFPGGWMPADPVRSAQLAQRFGFDAHRLVTADGGEIPIWHRGDGGDRALIYVGGNAEPVESCIRFVGVLPPGWDLIGVGLRGFPGSEGTPTAAGFREDLLAAWAFATVELGIPPERVVLHGRSLGGGVVGSVADAVTPGGVVLESTFDDFGRVAAWHVPWLPVRLLLRHPMPTAQRVASWAPPGLQVHSADDDVIPVERARALAQAWERGHYVEVGEFRHNDDLLLDSPKVRDAWRAFLAKVVLDGM